MEEQQISKSIRIDLYSRMFKIRRFEEEISKRYAAGEAPGFIHSSIGTEAVASGVAQTCATATRLCLPIEAMLTVLRRARESIG